MRLEHQKDVGGRPIDEDGRLLAKAGVVFAIKEQPSTEVVSPITTTAIPRNPPVDHWENSQRMLPSLETGSGRDRFAMRFDSSYVPNYDSFAKMHRDQLLTSQKAYSLFCSDLGNCKCVRVLVYDIDDHQDELVIILARIPLLVRYVPYGGAEVNGKLYEGYKGRWYLQEGDNLVSLKNQKSATITSKEMVSEWLRPTYSINRHPPLINNLYYFIDLTTSSDSQRLVWEKYKHYLYDLYADSSVPIYDVPIGDFYSPRDLRQEAGTLDPDLPTIEEEEGEEDASYSEQTWAGIQGIYTTYADNLGLYLPDGLMVDKMLLDDFIHKYGNMGDLVVCRRSLNAGEQENIDQINAAIGWLPFIGQIDDAYVSAVKSQKWLFPRVYAFGRQTTKVDSYQVYEGRCRSLGAKLFNEFSLTNTNRFFVNHDQWLEFMIKLCDSNAIPEELLPDEAILGYGE